LSLNSAVAAAVLLWLAVRDRQIAWRSVLWVYAALCVAALVLLGELHVRFAIYGEAAAAAVMPVALTECTRLLAARPLAVQAILRSLAVLLVLLATRANVLAQHLAPDAHPSSPDSRCSVRKAARLLAPYAGQVVLSDANDAPELLYRTQLKTVGSLYRNVDGFMRLRAAWRSGPSRLEPQEVSATGATFVLFCPRSPRSILVADLPEQTLLDRLTRGEVPPWLHLVATDPQSGFSLYRVASP